MVKVVGVRFRTAGKIYFFDPLDFSIKRGEKVIVETARGIEFGTVVGEIREVEESAVVQPLKPILRIATQRDKDQEAGNKEKEREAFKICQEKIRKHGLEMKLIDAEYTFDNNKVLFYFTADGRVDFRELVKDLAGVFKTRIELRQIGVRDETKIMGGIGICGRPLCCHSYLSDFIAVSIKMAKEQNLSLNPTKISGVCGRLMCCLKNEEDTYEELNRRLPNVGEYVTTTDGQRGEVHSVNVLRQRVKVLVEVGDDKELKEFEAEQIKFHRHHGKKGKENLSPEELRELEKLEKEEEEEIQAERAEKEASGRASREGRDHKQRGERQGNDRSERQDKGDRQGKGKQGGQGGEKNQSHDKKGGERQGNDKTEKGERRGDKQNNERRDKQGKQGGQGGERNPERQGKNRNRGPKDQQQGEKRPKPEGERHEKQEGQEGGGKNRNRGNRPFRDRNRGRDRDREGQDGGKTGQE